MLDASAGCGWVSATAAKTDVALMSRAETIHLLVSRQKNNLLS